MRFLIFIFTFCILSTPGSGDTRSGLAGDSSVGDSAGALGALAKEAAYRQKTHELREQGKEDEAKKLEELAELEKMQRLANEQAAQQNQAQANQLDGGEGGGEEDKSPPMMPPPSQQQPQDDKKSDDEDKPQQQSQAQQPEPIKIEVVPAAMVKELGRQSPYSDILPELKAAFKM